MIRAVHKISNKSLPVVLSAVTSACLDWTGRWASSSPWRSLLTGRSSSAPGTSSGKSWASCCLFSGPRAPPPGPCLSRRSGRRQLTPGPRRRSGPCLDPPASQRGSGRGESFYLQALTSVRGVPSGSDNSSSWSSPAYMWQLVLICIPQSNIVKPHQTEDTWGKSY